MKNGPAFPVAEGPTDNVNPGMTLRDYFAAKAMQALIGKVTENPAREDTQRVIAQNAYEIADAMMKTREEGDNEKD